MNPLYLYKNQIVVVTITLQQLNNYKVMVWFKLFAILNAILTIRVRLAILIEKTQQS